MSTSIELNFSRNCSKRFRRDSWLLLERMKLYFKRFAYPFQIYRDLLAPLQGRISLNFWQASGFTCSTELDFPVFTNFMSSVSDLFFTGIFFEYAKFIVYLEKTFSLKSIYKNLSRNPRSQSKKHSELKAGRLSLVSSRIHFLCWNSIVGEFRFETKRRNSPYNDFRLLIQVQISTAD